MWGSVIILLKFEGGQLIGLAQSAAACVCRAALAAKCGYQRLWGFVILLLKSGKRAAWLAVAKAAV